MTKNVENRARVQPGIRTGGQFAAEMHSEPAGVTLTLDPSPLDKAAVAVVADMVRTRAAYEAGKWQRRMDKPHMRGAETPLPPELVEMNRQAAEFESLSRDEQGDVLDKLKFGGAKHLLEPGQKLGNDRVLVADDVTMDEGNVGLALIAQKQIADAGLHGTVTLIKIDDATEFSVEDGVIKHEVRIGRTMQVFSATSGDAEDYNRDGWLYRSDIGVYGGDVFEQDRTDSLSKHFGSHREYAAMMDVVASSSFKDSEEHLGELDRSARTAVIRTDGTENLLDVSGDEPVLKTEDGQQTLHPSMVRGFLNHMATQTGHPDGEAFVSDLREVFRETDRRLIP